MASRLGKVVQHGYASYPVNAKCTERRELLVTGADGCPSTATGSCGVTTGEETVWNNIFVTFRVSYLNSL